MYAVVFYRCIRAFKTNVSRYVSMIITATYLHVHKHYFFTEAWDYNYASVF